MEGVNVINTDPVCANMFLVTHTVYAAANLFYCFLDPLDAEERGALPGVCVWGGGYGSQPFFLSLC